MGVDAVWGIPFASRLSESHPFEAISQRNISYDTKLGSSEIAQFTVKPSPASLGRSVRSVIDVGISCLIQSYVIRISILPESGGERANSQFASEGVPALSTASWRSCWSPV